ncbi:hypothetical protein GDO81_007567 [Engystomops pustulosus]|uniref:Uncharacterized protein n=1 Tax=Engystomops pustulosus TaxID=76066 RepID=A0AAV7C7X4_ENGPU|nr:hypothetical protein GDO81_007567 [Engystomops pustulosus]
MCSDYSASCSVLCHCNLGILHGLGGNVTPIIIIEGNCLLLGPGKILFQHNLIYNSISMRKSTVYIRILLAASAETCLMS